MSRISIETVSNLNYMPLPSKSERVPYPILKKELTKIRFPVYEDHDDVANDKYARVIMIFIKSCKKLMNDKNEMEQKRKLIRETLTERYGRRLILEEVFDKNVYEVRDGDELEGFYKAATGDDFSMELPLASVEMCEAFTDFVLNSQEDIRAAIQAAEAETAKLDTER